MLYKLEISVYLFRATLFSVQQISLLCVVLLSEIPLWGQD